MVYKIVLSLAVAASLATINAGSAVADAPHHVMLPAGACNQGTAAARVISGNGIVPMYMSREPIGCMTMPGAFLP